MRSAQEPIAAISLFSLSTFQPPLGAFPVPVDPLVRFQAMPPPDRSRISRRHASTFFNLVVITITKDVQNELASVSDCRCFRLPVFQIAGVSDCPCFRLPVFHKNCEPQKLRTTKLRTKNCEPWDFSVFWIVACPDVPWTFLWQ